MKRTRAGRTLSVPARAACVAAGGGVMSLGIDDQAWPTPRCQRLWLTTPAYAQTPLVRPWALVDVCAVRLNPFAHIIARFLQEFGQKFHIPRAFGAVAQTTKIVTASVTVGREGRKRPNLAMPSQSVRGVRFSGMCCPTDQLMHQKVGGFMLQPRWVGPTLPPPHFSRTRIWAAAKSTPASCDRYRRIVRGSSPVVTRNTARAQTDRCCGLRPEA